MGSLQVFLPEERVPKSIVSAELPPCVHRESVSQILEAPQPQPTFNGGARHLLPTDPHSPRHPHLCTPEEVSEDRLDLV